MGKKSQYEVEIIGQIETLKEQIVETETEKFNVNMKLEGQQGRLKMLSDIHEAASSKRENGKDAQS